MAQFFQKINNEWDAHASLRRSYAEGIPIPNKKYFNGIHSIDDFAHLLVRPIEKPIWLGINAIGYLLKAFLNALAMVVLAPIALVATLISPSSNLSRSINSAFCSAVANTIVSIGMTLLAAVSAVAALVFNPLYLAGRCLGTIFDRIQAITEPCCGSSNTLSL